ncbi:hypothetical protein Patl1_30291 [Pistacia atlantica]|uniref:Uncharacterized protein n=1 Tax=Pistacia atlantica TaxID=434234 RepID=A0ACC1AEM3_9ROSI|nr:hypothetical protein Patl1_30291 [Pistacia atlantica]
MGRTIYHGPILSPCLFEVKVDTIISWAPLQPPPESDPSYPTWEAENSLLMASLINSMEPDIGQLYLFLPTAKAI